jgi:YGGT family.
MVVIIGLAEILLDVLWWLIIVQVAVSWLIAFNVLNMSSPALRSAISWLDVITAPLYRPLRRILPDFGGLDFSPLIILLVIALIEGRLLEPLKASYQFGG